MNLEKYDLASDDTRSLYEFYSEGPKGKIKKVVRYREINPGLFNLGFGDGDNISNNFDDKARSNNGDRDKILNTIAATCMDFLKRHRPAFIFARGNTPARNRLYQMAIARNLIEIKKLFLIEGYYTGRWETFEVGKNYEAFLLGIK